MSDQPSCPKCGQLLPAHAPAGLCPPCLIRAGLESESEPLAGPAATIPSPATSRFEPLSVESLAGKFPQLEILELLGKGGMGAVYKARQRGLDRLVAVKVLPPEIGHDLAFAERFTREARALARLSHNHIVSVFDFGQSDGLFYIVMEYVDGVNLRQTIQTGKLTPAEALAIVPQICEALQFAHDEGIVHRDIKPENILIDKRGRVKIADFGLAKLLGQDAGDPMLTATHQIMGTLRYMAPEQMQGTREVDHRADIYSLGVIFYELLTGDLPMGKFAPPSKRVQIDVRLDEIVLRALEQQPEQRYQHASDIKTDMDAISRSPKGLVGTLGQARDEWWAARGVATPKAASDGLVFRRLSLFNLLFWLVWSALLAGMQRGYLSDAKWYFQKELPYSFLSGGWNLVSAMFAFFFVYWWYLLAKSPETPRSLPDAWRTIQTPDRRAIRLGMPAAAFVAVWITAIVVTMNFYDDDVQSTTLTALIIAAPLMVAGSSWWAYRERVGELLRDQGPAADASTEAARTSHGDDDGQRAARQSMAEAKSSHSHAAERSPLSPDNPPHQAKATSGLFSLLSKAWDEWWADRAKWFTVSVQTVLFLVHLICLIGFISMTTRGTWDEQGRRQFTYQLGVPSPWFRFETWPEPNTAFRHGLYPWTSSLLLAVAGLALGYVICRIEKARNPKAGFWHSPSAMLIIWLVFAMVGVGVGTVMGFRAVRERRPAAAEPAAVPSLGTITSGIGVSFTVPAGQVAMFEIVTRRDNATVPIPSHSGYVMAAGKPLEGTFLWTHVPGEVVAEDGRRSWQIETRYAGGGKNSSGGYLLPEGLDSAVGSKSLGLGLLEPSEEIISWCGNVDANKLPASGLIGVRITVVPHGLNKSGSGAGHIDWKTEPPPTTTRRKLPPAAAETDTNPESKWARQLADSYLQAAGSNNADEPRVTSWLSESFKKRFQIPGGVDTWVYYRFKSYVINTQELSPTQDEAILKGTLEATKRHKYERLGSVWRDTPEDFAGTIRFTLRLVKEKDSGRWRVDLVQFELPSDTTPARGDGEKAKVK